VLESDGMDMEQYLVIADRGNGNLHETPAIVSVGILCQHDLACRRRNRGGRCQHGRAEPGDAAGSEAQGDALCNFMHDVVLPPVD